MRSIATIAMLDNQTLRSLLFHLNKEIYTSQFICSLLRVTSGETEISGNKFMSMLWKMKFCTANPVGQLLLQDLLSFVLFHFKCR